MVSSRASPRPCRTEQQAQTLPFTLWNEGSQGAAMLSRVCLALARSSCRLQNGVHSGQQESARRQIATSSMRRNKGRRQVSRSDKRREKAEARANELKKKPKNPNDERTEMIWLAWFPLTATGVLLYLSPGFRQDLMDAHDRVGANENRQTRKISLPFGGGKKKTSEENENPSLEESEHVGDGTTN